jgi:hypothetical protein
MDITEKLELKMQLVSMVEAEEDPQFFVDTITANLEKAKKEGDQERIKALEAGLKKATAYRDKKKAEAEGDAEAAKKAKEKLAKETEPEAKPEGEPEGEPASKEPVTKDTATDGDETGGTATDGDETGGTATDGGDTATDGGDTATDGGSDETPKKHIPDEKALRQLDNEISKLEKRKTEYKTKAKNEDGIGKDILMKKVEKVGLQIQLANLKIKKENEGETATESVSNDILERIERKMGVITEAGVDDEISNVEQKIVTIDAEIEDGKTKGQDC